jgi:hypothetical protein
MRKSIEVMLVCGLGNQMFQYAIGRCLSIRLGLPLVLDISLVRTFKECARPEGVSDPLWGFDLRCFRLGKQRIRNLSFLHWRARNKLLRVLVSNGIGLTRLIDERTSQFDSQVVQIDGPCRLNGYWQSDRYFEPISEQLRQDFTILPTQDERSAELQARMRKVKSVGLHVRRGDYVTDKNYNAFHGTCPKEYYDAALELVLSRLGPDAELFVFSDDIGWTREHIRYSLPTTYVDWNAKRNHEDLRLMSACNALVIANSSFSWWAGWLNPNPDKFVVAPKRWFQAPGAVSDLPKSPWLVAI